MIEDQKELNAKVKEIAANVAAIGRIAFFCIGIFLTHQMLDWIVQRGNPDNVFTYGFSVFAGFGMAWLFTSGMGFRDLKPWG